MKYLVLLFTFLLAVPGYSEVLTGKVLDKKTDEPLIGATVLLEGTGLGDYTDSKGMFTIKGVSNKKYKLIVSSEGT